MRRRQPLFLLAVLAILTAAAPAALAQDSEEPEGSTPEPTLEANLQSAAFGERVIVRGENWPPNSIVQVQICGNEGLNGSSDCDSITSVQSGVNTLGSFGAVMLVGNPPVPCPCVFRAAGITNGIVKTLDFTLLGAASNPEGASQLALPERRLDITEARIEGSGPWTALFGARPNRALVLTIVNTGFVPVDNPQLELALGKGPDPTGFVQPPEIGRLEPGDSRTLTVDLEMPVFAIGTYAVEGRIPGFDTPVEFRAESSHIPWLLLILPTLILIQIILVAIRNRVRRRIHEPEEAPEYPQEDYVAPTAPPTAREEVVSEDQVIDVREETPGRSVFAVPGDETDPDADELEAIIGEELDAVFTEAMSQHDGTMTNGEWAGVITELSREAADRIADRADLRNGESEQLHAQITVEMLSAFGIDPEPAGAD